MSDGRLAALAEAGHDEEATAALAGQRAANAPLAVQCAKRLIHEQLGMGFEQAMQQVGVFLDTLRESEDHRAGVQAFLEKREPVFKGR